MFYRPTNPEGLLDAGRGLAGAPSVGPVKRWLYGVALAALVVLLGAWLVANPKGAFILLVLHLDGRAGGMVLVTVGLTAHFHYFWAPSERFWRIGHYGKILSLAGMVLALGYMIFRRVYAGFLA